MNILEQYVGMRFRLWSNSIVWVIYEACPEEGENVSKKLHVFNDEGNAKLAFEHHKKAYLKWLLASCKVTQTKIVGKKPTINETLVALKTKGKDTDVKEPY